MRSIVFYYFTFLLTHLCFAQNKINDQKVVLITLDGLRWQELFSGADPLIIKNENFVKHPDDLYDWAWENKQKKKITFNAFCLERNSKNWANFWK